MSAADEASVAGEACSHVTVAVAGQCFGIPIERVRDVFVIGELTPVPLAPADVAGLLNLRGRIITALDLRARLCLPAAAAGTPRMAVGIDLEGESYCLVVDEVGGVVRLARRTGGQPPVHLDPRWAALSLGVHRLAESLLVELDIDAVLALEPTCRAA